MKKITTHSKLQTQKIAKELASFIAENSKKNRKTNPPFPVFLSPFNSKASALVIALKGNLGAGKTTFIQGFLRGLGVKFKITSPTFVIIKNYQLPITNYRSAYHIDCYRIKNHKEILDLGFKEIISNPQNIVLIEWPERIAKVLPKKRISILFKYGDKENKRELYIKH